MLMEKNISPIITIIETPSSQNLLLNEERISFLDGVKFLHICPIVIIMYMGLLQNMKKSTKLLWTMQMFFVGQQRILKSVCKMRVRI